MTIFVFGNPILEQDYSAVKLIPELEKHFPDITFIHADPTEGWQRKVEDVVIIDTVMGIEHVTTFDSLNDFEKTTGKLTVHDYDLYMDLALLMKIGTIKTITIIGLPSDLIKVPSILIREINQTVSKFDNV